MKKIAKEEQDKALTWIKNNPHQALAAAVQTHQGWYGCGCELSRLVADKEFCKKYNIKESEK